MVQYRSRSDFGPGIVNALTKDEMIKQFKFEMFTNNDYGQLGKRDLTNEQNHQIFEDVQESMNQLRNIDDQI